MKEFRWVVIVLLLFVLPACGGSGGGNGGEDAVNSVAAMDMTAELETIDRDAGNIPGAGSYDINTFINAETAQKQIAENNIPTVVEIKGSIYVLDISSWPQGWDIMKVVSVRMPDGMVEYKRIINRFDLLDGRLAIGILEASVLDVVDSGVINLDGNLTNLISQTAVQSNTSVRSTRALVSVIDKEVGQTVEIFKAANVDLVDYVGNNMSAGLGFPEISLTANPALVFKLNIDKPYGFSDVIGTVADISVDIIAKSKSVLEEIDGSVKYGDGRGIISAGVNLDQADYVTAAILATSEVAQKVEALVSALADKRRVKLASAGVSGDVEGLIALRAYASAAYGRSGEAPLGVVLIPITGPVPIFLKFDLAGIYSMDLDAYIEAETSLSLSIPLDAEVRIVDGEFEELTQPDFSPVVIFQPPAVSGDGAFEATAGLKLNAGISLANILDTTLNPQAEAVFASTASIGSGTCSVLDWDLYGRVSTELEAVFDIKIISVSNTWDTPLDFTVYQDREPFGTYMFGNCSGGEIETTWYADNDGDNYGDSKAMIRAVSQPPGYVADNTDCNDIEATISPSATESYDFVDNNCNGTIDEGFTTIAWFADSDVDSYGDPDNMALAVTQPAGYVADNTDCDDTQSSVHPSATEILNDGIDQDCSGEDAITANPWVVVSSMNLAAGTTQPDTVNLEILSNGDPVISYGGGWSNTSNAYVEHFDGTSWEILGGQAVSTTPVWNGYVDLELSPAGIPYAIYNQEPYDYVSVVKYVAGEWLNIGELPSTSGTVHLKFSSNGTPYIAYYDNIYYSSSRDIVVKKYENNEWQSVGLPIAGNSANYGGHQAIDIYLEIIDGTPYLSYVNDGEYTGFVVVDKFDGNQWVTIRENLERSSRYTTQNILPLSGSSDGSLFLGVENSGTSTTQVLKYDGSSWSQIGDDLPDGPREKELIVYNGSPIIAYYVNSTVGTLVRRFNDSTGDWEDLFDSENVYNVTSNSKITSLAVHGDDLFLTNKEYVIKRSLAY